MTDRTSIEVEGLGHGGLPIPAASRIGNFVATGGVRGVDPKTGKMPDDVTEQAALMFANLRLILAAAGAGPEHVLKMTVWIKAPEARVAVNEEWVKMFPDSSARPARHTLNYDLPGGMLVQCDALAVIT
jgi:2-iminobutanoate/2-iminopropanoate deaminase